MTESEAEMLAIRALGWLAGNEVLWPGFLAATGASPADIRAGAGDPAFLGAVLDYLTQADASVVAFCDAEGFDYAAPLAARQALPSGGATHWT